MVTAFPQSSGGVAVFADVDTKYSGLNGTAGA